jgi:hypothetical protein
MKKPSAVGRQQSATDATRRRRAAPRAAPAGCDHPAPSGASGPSGLSSDTGRAERAIGYYLERGQPLYVGSLPGDGGPGWGFDPHREGAIPLTPAQQREFAAERNYCGRQAFFEPYQEPDLTWTGEHRRPATPHHPHFQPGGPFSPAALHHVAGLTRTQFLAAPPPGFTYRPDAYFMGQRTSRDQITLGPSFFKEPPGPDRLALLYHELGHDLMRDYADWQLVLEPFRLDRDRPVNVRSTFNNPFGFSDRPEEMLADAYATLMTDPRLDQHYSGAKYRNLLHRVRQIAAHIGLPLPERA